MLKYERPPVTSIALRQPHFVHNTWRSFVESARRALSLLRLLVRRIKAFYRQPADVTDWERSQAALDSISEAVAITDFRGHVVYLNKAAERLTGCQQQSAVDRAVAEVFPVIDAASGAAIDNLAANSIIENEKRTAPPDSLLKRPDGVTVAVEISSTPIQDRHGAVVGAVIVARDMTVLRESAKKLLYLALHDHLTELPNRTLFADRLEHAISRSKRTNVAFSVLYIDLDNFKTINDTLGHETGDQLLQTAATRLQQCIRRSDTVSRHGGDEFIALLDECAEIDAAHCAEKIVSALSEPYIVSGRPICLSASIGIAVFPADATERRELVRAADLAMYRVKCAGGGGFQRFDRAHGSGGDLDVVQRL